MEKGSYEVSHYKSISKPAVWFMASSLTEVEAFWSHNTNTNENLLEDSWSVNQKALIISFRKDHISNQSVQEVKSEVTPPQIMNCQRCRSQTSLHHVSFKNTTSEISSLLKLIYSSTTAGIAFINILNYNYKRLLGY